MLLFDPQAFTRPLTNPAHGTHNPAPSIIVHISRHDGREAATAVTFGICLKSAVTSALLRGILGFKDWPRALGIELRTRCSSSSHNLSIKERNLKRGRGCRRDE